MTSTTKPGAFDASGAAPAPPPQPRLRLFGWVMLIASAAIAALGVVWVLAPTTSPFSGANGFSSPLGGVFGPTAVAGIAIGSGAAGALLAALPAGTGRLPRSRAFAAAAALLAVVGIAAFGSFSVLAFAGYLFGLVAVAAAVVTVVVALVRAPRVGLWFLGGFVAIVGVAALSGVTFEAVAVFATMFAEALVPQLPGLGAALVIVVAVLAWAGFGITGFRATGSGRRFDAWLVRHRTAITVLAALGPMPYAIARVSWLTPWPLFGPSADEMPAAVLVTGLMLGSGAVAAAVLTIGLVRPWSLRFPAWMPVVGRRVVPSALPVGFGFFVAVLLCLAAVPLLQLLSAGATDLLTLLEAVFILPVWYWGPMLLLAVWAYAAYRRAVPVAADAARHG